MSYQRPPWNWPPLRPNVRAVDPESAYAALYLYAFIRRHLPPHELVLVDAPKGVSRS